MEGEREILTLVTVSAGEGCILYDCNLIINNFICKKHTHRKTKPRLAKRKKKKKPKPNL